eukprot:COSAG01_NODE_25530_length_741_cov_15.348910_1_plen_88_part_10
MRTVSLCGLRPPPRYRTDRQRRPVQQAEGRDSYALGGGLQPVMVATTETTTLTEETTITTQQAAGLTRPSTGVPMSAGDTHRSVYYNG